MPGAAMAAVEVLGVPREELSHDGGNPVLSALEENMDVVIHKDPGVDGAFAFADGLAETLQEAGLILAVSENGALVDPPHHDMMQGAGDI